MSTDRYRDWDGAYLLGSLSSAERREYERHLAECADCRAAVAEFVGLPGLLARIPAEEAQRLLESPVPEPARSEPAPPSLLDRLAAAAATARRRTRFRVAGLVLAAAAVSALAVVAIPWATSSVSSPSGYHLALDAEPGVPVTASVTFVPEAWGTRIDMDCSYEEAPSGDGPTSWEYVMYVTDAQGEEHAIGSWTSTPGTTMHPSLATGLSVDQIVSIDVRSATSGRVVLTGAP